MTRTQRCREQLEWIGENCPLDRTSVIPIKRANDFCEKHVEISTLSTDAIQPLLKIKDETVLRTVLDDLKVQIETGKKPTKKDVTRCIHANLPQKPEPNVNDIINKWQKEIVFHQAKIEKLQAKIAEILKREDTQPTPPYGKVVVDSNGKPKVCGKQKVTGLKNAPLHAGRNVDIDEPITDIIEGEYSYRDAPGVIRS
jgi:hypothetical protein